MFGTGIKGFIGITIGVASVTYVAIVVLMYPKDIGMAFGRFWKKLGWTGEVENGKLKAFAPKGKTVGLQSGKSKGSEKGREREKNGVGDEGVAVAEPEVRQRPKRKIRKFFRRGDKQVRDQETGNLD